VAVVENSPQRTPVEIIVTFKNNQKGSLFYIKHKRHQGAKAAARSSSMSANEMETDKQNSNFGNFSRRLSHVLLQKMLETQGLQANDHKHAIV